MTITTTNPIQEFRFPVFMDQRGKVQIGEPAEAYMIIVADTETHQLIHGDLEMVAEYIKNDAREADDRTLLPYEEYEGDGEDRRDLVEIFNNPTFGGDYNHDES